MMFSEDYVQSMVTAREAASLMREVEQVRVVRERFAEVPARGVLARGVLARGVLARLGELRAARRARRVAATRSAAAVSAARAAGTAVPGGGEGASGGTAQELAGARR